VTEIKNERAQEQREHTKIA